MKFDNFYSFSFKQDIIVRVEHFILLNVITESFVLIQECLLRARTARPDFIALLEGRLFSNII